MRYVVKRRQCSAIGSGCAEPSALGLVMVGGTLRDYYKFARLEKTVRSVKEDGAHCEGTATAALQGKHARLAAAQNSGSWKARH
jgi:hypothetical protein